MGPDKGREYYQQPTPMVAPPPSARPSWCLWSWRQAAWRQVCNTVRLGGWRLALSLRRPSAAGARRGSGHRAMQRSIMRSPHQPLTLTLALNIWNKTTKHKIVISHAIRDPVDRTRGRDSHTTTSQIAYPFGITCGRPLHNLTGPITAPGSSGDSRIETCAHLLLEW